MKRFAVAATVVLVLAALLLPMVASAESDSSWLNRARKRIGRELVEAQSTTWPSVLRYYTYDVEYNDPVVTIQGRDMVAEFLGRFFANSPDLITTVGDETCINDIYMATWTMDGSFAGLPYTAKGVSVIKFRPRGLKVYYQKDYYSEGDIMTSIPELAPVIEGFRVFYRCAVDPTYDCPIPVAAADAGTDEQVERMDGSETPGALRLRQNVPNPFNPVTTIAYDVPQGGADMSLKIYDVSGRLVRTLVDGYESAGTRSVTWDGTNDHGQALASGIYFSRMTAPEYSQTVKMIMLK
jgi:hypothetical protein